MQESWENLEKLSSEVIGALSGRVKAVDVRVYVVCAVFYKRMCERLLSHMQVIEGLPSYQEALDSSVGEDLKRRTTESLGFFVYPSRLFTNLPKAAQENENLCALWQKAFHVFEASSSGQASEDNFSGLFLEFDISGQCLGETMAERNTSLSIILQMVERHDSLNPSPGELVNFFGDFYEVFMSRTESNIRKKSAQFFTPDTVSRLIARLAIAGMAPPSTVKVYDPACGAGSLLAHMWEELRDKCLEVKLYGQEVDPFVWNLARMNLLAQGVPGASFEVAFGDTITSPQLQEFGPFDVIVANPPYSLRWRNQKDESFRKDPRFQGVPELPPSDRCDYVFLLHSLSWLSDEGRLVAILPPGVCYRSGAEEKIRRHMIESNVIEAVIFLPGGLFYSTGVATCILVLKKKRDEKRVLFIDGASAITEERKISYIESSKIEEIIDSFLKMKTVPGFCSVVSAEAIEAKSYDLSPNRYVESAAGLSFALFDDVYEKTKVERYAKQEIMGYLDVAHHGELAKFFDGLQVANAKLGEIIKIKSGSKPNKAGIVESGEFPIYMNSTNPYGRYMESNIPAGTTFVVTYGMAGHFKLTDEPAWVGPCVLFFEAPPGILPRYLHECIAGQSSTIDRFVRKTTVPDLPRSAIEDLSIPIPFPDDLEKSLEAQSYFLRFVDRLRFVIEGTQKEALFRENQLNEYRWRLLNLSAYKKA